MENISLEINVQTRERLNKTGEPIIDDIISELKQPLASINETIKKYKLVDPQKNVCPTWYNGKITIAFSDQCMPASAK